MADDDSDYEFRLGMDVSGLCDDGESHMAMLSISHAGPTTALATLYKMKQTIIENDDYLFSCLYEHAMEYLGETDEGKLWRPSVFAELFENSTETVTVPFPVEVMSSDGLQELKVLVTAPGYSILVDVLSNFLDDNNLDSMTNEMMNADLFNTRDVDDAQDLDE